MKNWWLWSWIAIKNKKTSQKVGRNHVGNPCQCCCLPTLAQIPAMEMWLGNINEMCLQGLNLWFARTSTSSHDSMLLYWVINAVGVHLCPTCCLEGPGGLAFSNLFFSLNNLYAHSTISMQLSCWACLAQPAMTINKNQNRRWKRVHSWDIWITDSNHKMIQMNYKASDPWRCQNEFLKTKS